MKQVQFSQFVDPARLLTYLLSRLVAQHSVETPAKSGSVEIGVKQAQLLCSPPRAAGDILKAAERCWPSRYY
jgi:hypothetical protein